MPHVSHCSPIIPPLIIAIQSFFAKGSTGSPIYKQEGGFTTITTIMNMVRASISILFAVLLLASHDVFVFVKAQLVDTSYEIDLDVTGIVETFSSGFFISAAEKWTSVVTGDVPDVQGIEGDSQICGPYPNVIDDLWICGRFQPIDFFGGVLAMAGPTILRTGSNIPAAGIMLFDKFDLPQMWLEGSIQGIILHEMGHILGIGTNWETAGLQQRDAQGNCPYAADSAASREYQALSGCSGEAIPIEYDGAEGTRCGHFDETCFKDELMTGFASGNLPLSRVTVGTLEDLGYEVNYDAADAFSAADLDESCRCDNDGGRNLFETNNRAKRQQQQEQQAKRKLLSDAGLALAQKAGLEHLKLMTQDKSTFVNNNIQENGRNDVTFVGDKYVHVFYMENNVVHDVLVWAGEKS